MYCGQNNRGTSQTPINVNICPVWQVGDWNRKNADTAATDNMFTINTLDSVYAEFKRAICNIYLFEFFWNVTYFLNIFVDVYLQ